MFRKFSFLCLLNITAFNGVQVEAKEDKEVFIYHTTASAVHLASIKRSGLCSGWGAVFKPFAFVQYCKEYDSRCSTQDCFEKYLMNLHMVIQTKKALGFADQFSVIYFKPEEPGVKESANIAIKVNPDTTYVYNMEHRATAWQANPDADALYRKSRVLLSDYLTYLEEAKKMVLVRPDLEVQLDPETARPFYLEHNDPRRKQVKINGQWVESKGIGCSVYNAEVIIPKRCIPLRKLIFLKDDITRYSSSTPVENTLKS